MPASSKGQLVSSGTPDETMPQPNAHMGGNQVIGFSSSSVAEALGRAGLERVDARFAMGLTV